MKLSEIVTVSGKGGLFHIVKTLRAGLVLESLDEKKTKVISGPTSKVSVLSEVSVYTKTKEDTAPLRPLLVKFIELKGAALAEEGNADEDQLRKVMREALPEYDEARVYVSDIRKMVKWAHLLATFAPEALQEEKEQKEEKPPKADKKEKEDDKPEKEPGKEVKAARKPKK